MSQSFAQIMEAAHAVDGGLDLHVSDDWLQGRSLFGGLQAALGLIAMRSLVPHQPLRSLQTNFVAPLAGHVRAESTILRAGKNTTQVEYRLVGDAGVTTTGLAIFGAEMDSIVEVVLGPPPSHTTPPLAFPSVPGLTPNFLQHFHMQMLTGHPPFSGVPTTKSALLLDMLDEGPATEHHLIAFADVVPPLGLSFASKPSFGSTLSWMLEILAVPPAETPLSGWRLDSELLSAHGGYTNQSNTLWSPGWPSLSAESAIHAGLLLARLRVR